MEAQLLSLVNMERLRRHLPALRLTRSLRGAARLGSAAILDAGVFSHAPSWEARVRRTTRADGVAEALVWGAGSWATPEHLTAAWMASARHRAIFLDPALRRVGFGATVGSFEGHGLVVMVTADLATAH